MSLTEQLQAALGSGYRVAHELTGGGMSRVFVVHELELDRKLVAKVLPPELAAGVSIERFRREIQLAAKLQHPHIVPLLAAGARDGLLYYTMPFIEGESLRARLGREHQLPVADVVRIVREVADALSYAHQHNVVHRDIKPDNVLLSGHHALVTDFGVSKAISTASTGNAITSVGVALGTPSYMSPEQISADPTTDHRADIYAMGALAYELLAGRPPFVGHSAQHILSAHLTQTPEPIRTQRPAVSAELEQVVMRCLEKTPADRWQSADELLTQLESLATPRLGLPPTQAMPAHSRSRRWWFVAGAAVTATAVTLVAMKTGRAPGYVTGATRQLTNSVGLEVHPVLSPDGKLVAYAGGTVGSLRIYTRQVGGERALLLSEGVPGDHRMPQWSVDGTQIAFFSDSGVFVVPAFGGQPRHLPLPIASSFDKRSGVASIASLSPDFQRVAFVDDADNLIVASVSGGQSTIRARVRDIHTVAWSPDGKRLAYVINNADYAYSSTSFGNIAPSAVWVTSLDGEPVRITDAVHLNTSPVWTPDGNLLYVSNIDGGRDIYLQPLSTSGSPIGPRRRITTGLNVHTIGLSGDGTRLVYADFRRRANVWVAPVTAGRPADPATARAITDENQLVEGAAVSHDGQWLVYDSNRGGRQQLYKIRVSGGEPVQLTTDSTDHFAARWTADDRRIVYHLWRNGSRDLAIIDADGRNREIIVATPAHEYYPDISPDGNRLLLRLQRGALLTTALMERTSQGWSEPRVLVDSSQGGRWAADGRRFAVATMSGSLIVGTVDGERRTLVRASRSPGTNARSVAWSRDGSQVFYVHSAPSGELSYWSVPAAGGTPRLVLDFPRGSAARPRRVEFDTDGRNLYFAVAQDESDVWMLELRKP